MDAGVEVDFDTVVKGLLDEKEKNILDKQKDIQEQEANVEKIKEEQMFCVDCLCLLKLKNQC